ncbi:MAG: hypothetical protein JW885_11655 [Deltaproteobacteria bacterium]|nr:hypothetical protein [Candidatus Zymogenaceae bacterium]
MKCRTLAVVPAVAVLVCTAAAAGFKRAVEVETGRSDIEANIGKLSHLKDSRVIFYAVNREVEEKINGITKNF